MRGGRKKNENLLWSAPTNEEEGGEGRAQRGCALGVGEREEGDKRAH